MGQTGSGGGNTVNYRLVEKYAIDRPETLRGFAELKTRIAQIRKTFPTLAIAIESRLKEMEWYLVPQKISTLPRNQTGLHFTTEQPAYQTRTELFLSETALKKMERVEIGDVLLHEGVMALQRDKSADLVRPVTARLLRTMTPERISEIQKFLAENQFGPYFTGEQLDAIIAKKSTPLFFANILYDNENVEACTGTTDDDKLFERMYEFDQDAWIGTSMNLIRQLSRNRMGTNTLWSYCGWSNSPTCKEVYGLVSDNAKNLPNYGIRKRAFELAGDEVNRKEREIAVNLVEHLSNSDAYVTMIALSNAEVEKFEEFKASFGQREHELFSRVMTKVEAKKAQIALADSTTVAKARCESLKRLRKEYLKVAPKNWNETH